MARIAYDIKGTAQILSNILPKAVSISRLWLRHLAGDYETTDLPEISLHYKNGSNYKSNFHRSYTPLG